MIKVHYVMPRVDFVVEGKTFLASRVYIAYKSDFSYMVKAVGHAVVFRDAVNSYMRGMYYHNAFILVSETTVQNKKELKRVLKAYPSEGLDFNEFRQ